MTIDDLDGRMQRLLGETRAELELIIPATKNPWINEQSHLQPSCARAAKSLAEEWGPAPVSTSTKAKHALWPRLGNIDVSFSWPDAPPTHVELKCESDKGKHALCACAWDAVKLAFTQLVGGAGTGYLIAGLPTAEWDAGQRGTRLFTQRTWDILELRQGFLDWWQKWEKEDYWPRRVPQRLSTTPIALVEIDVKGVAWQLRLARVDAPDVWADWPSTLAAG